MKILNQCGILFGICLLGELLRGITKLPIPGNVFGMAILFLLLCTGVLKKSQIEDVSSFLLGTMSFFFIPSSVAILVYYEKIAKVIVPFALIAFFSTFIVLGATGWTAQIVQRIAGRGKGGPARAVQDQEEG